jgi:hypothetical protein
MQASWEMLSEARVQFVEKSTGVRAVEALSLRKDVNQIETTESPRRL